MFNRFLHKLTIFCVFNIFFSLVDLHSQNATLREATSNEYISNQEKEALDLNKINSSVDAGSFYSIDTSIRQLEENMSKMVQELNRLKQHVEFAKVSEQKRILQNQKIEKDIQKLEKENAKFHQAWLNNSLDNSLTGSSSKIESMESADNKYHDFESTSTIIVKQPEIAQISTVTSPESSQIAIATLQSEPTQTVTATPQKAMSQYVSSQPVRQDVVVEIIE